MSGICGIVFQNGRARVKTDDLNPMVRALEMSEQSDGFSVFIGSLGIGGQGFMGRLSGVSKKIVYERPLALSFHGSLHNLNELFESGVQSRSFPECLLNRYLQEGMKFVSQLRGEFAMSLWDSREEALYLVTDRFRAHPVFYYQDQDKLVFASSMRSILACPLEIKRTINPEAIVDLVSASYIPTPKTIYGEVKKLPPGHVLTYRKGEAKSVPYWELSFLRPDKGSEKILARTLRERMTDAISTRLAGEANVNRVGAFLSGGVDSSTIVGLMSEIARCPIKTFSIGFGEERFNEIKFARLAAKAFGAEHFEYFVTPQDTYEAIPVLLKTFDEPFANASAVPTYFCSKLARDNEVDVLYAGDGGDELFAGNERYITQHIFDYFNYVPVFFRDLLVKPIVFGLAGSLKWNLFVKGKKYIQRASVPYPQRLTSYDTFKVIPMKGLFTDGFLDSIEKNYSPDAPVNEYYAQAPAVTDLDRQLYIDLKLAISDNDLFKVTRMTEAAGITVRYPFLDHRLAEFAATVPAKVKMRGTKLRSFFKKSYSEFLPPEILRKKKHGFGLPIPVWLRTDKKLNELMHDLVLSPSSLQRGYFRRTGLEELLKRHKTDETSFYGTALWNLMMLELWHRQKWDQGT